MDTNRSATDLATTYCAGDSPTTSAPKVRLATFDLGAFLGAQVVGEQAALGLDHEVQAFSTVLLNEHCPVGVVADEWCRHREPARELGVSNSSKVL